MAAPRRLYVALLELELARARHRHNVVLAALLEEAERQRQRAPDDKEDGGFGTGYCGDPYSANTKPSS